jgi:hypothetical protein
MIDELMKPKEDSDEPPWNSEGNIAEKLVWTVTCFALFGIVDVTGLGLAGKMLAFCHVQGSQWPIKMLPRA